MTVTTPEGRVYTGTPHDIVAQMRAADFGQSANLGEYIANMVRRVEDFYGVVITPAGTNDVERATSLLAGLLDAGLLKES